VHFEDQLASVKKCGHMGGKVLVPTQEANPEAGGGTLCGRRDGRADDRARVPMRSAAGACSPATWTRSDQAVLHRRTHTPEGFYKVKPGVGQSISRGLAYATIRDMVWCETGKPDLGFAKTFVRGDPQEVPGQAAVVQLLAVVQLGRRTSTTRRSRSSSANSARWATSTSSSRWRASTTCGSTCST